MSLLTASKSANGGQVPVPATKNAGVGNPNAERFSTYRPEDDPFLNGMLLELTAEETTVDEVAPPEPRPGPARKWGRGGGVLDEQIEEAIEEAVSEPRRKRRIPVFGLSLFALFVAAGAAYSSLRMPIGDESAAATPVVGAVAIPSAGVDSAPATAVAEADIDKAQERLPEWPAPPPLTPVSPTAAPLSVGVADLEARPEVNSVAGAAAVARTAVNMRSGPDTSAPVLTVVAAGTPVEVRACDFWCDVVVGGQEGWIYQDYLDGPIERRVR